MAGGRRQHGEMAEQHLHRGRPAHPAGYLVRAVAVGHGRHATPHPPAWGLPLPFHRYCKAYKRACQSSAVRKYFEHSGAMMTADGSDDDLIKFEGVPKGQKFTF